MSEDTARRQRVLAIFEEVADLPPGEGARRLDALCGGDADLRARVEAMLAADASDAEPFSGNAAQWADVLEQDATVALRAGRAPDDARAGETVGAWRITGLLGRGGMGAVHAVERADGAYVQKAALKRVHGADFAPSARERFLRERQVLARLQHPHIATLLDGGFDAGGDPYFVMERVDGVPIDRWCDEQRLGLRERVVLFLQVLDAVQYAHRNLVVHRDLKPSNLLVTPAGQVKLLDFGIARELEQAGLAATATSDRAMTLQYASPEQLHNLPITTATDIYQLGVVLYRLLSGTHPFGIDADTPLARQLQALSQDPQSITRSARQADAELAALRSETPASLARSLDGSLEAIVHACLRRDPSQRYASAEALANDLRAWLDDRPVSAAKLGRAERTKLWLRRNRTLAASAAAIAVALLTGTGVALWQAHEAREQARVAERESANARAVMAFLNDTLAAANPEQALDTEVSVRDLLDHARAKLDQRGTLDPQVRQPVQRMLGRLYASLGDNQLSLRMFEDGLAGVEPTRREEALALADDLVVYSDALGSLERNGEALAVAERAVALRTRFAPDDPEQRLRSLAHLTLGHLERDGLEAVRLRAEQSLALAGQLSDPPVDVVLDTYSDLSDIARVTSDRGRLLSTTREGLAFADSHEIAADSPVRIGLLRGLVEGLMLDGEPTEAESVIRRAIAAAERTGGLGGANLSVLYQALAETLMAQGRYRESLAELKRANASVAAMGEGPRNVIISMCNEAFLLAQIGDYPAAIAMVERAHAALAQAGLQEDDMFRRTAERTCANTLLTAGRTADAGAWVNDLLARARRLDGEDSEEAAVLLGGQAQVAYAVQEPERGMVLLAELRQRMSARGVGEDHEQFAHLLGMEALFDRQRGDLAAAEVHQREALRRLEAGTNVADVAKARATLADILAARGQQEEARRLLDQALPVLRETFLPSERGLVAAEALAKQFGR